MLIMAQAFSLHYLSHVLENVIEYPRHEYTDISAGTSCADLPKEFAVTKISVGEKSHLVLTEAGRHVLL